MPRLGVKDPHVAPSSGGLNGASMRFAAASALAGFPVSILQVLRAGACKSGVSDWEVWSLSRSRWGRLGDVRGYRGDGSVLRRGGVRGVPGGGRCGGLTTGWFPVWVVSGEFRDVVVAVTCWSP